MSNTTKEIVNQAVLYKQDKELAIFKGIAHAQTLVQQLNNNQITPEVFFREIESAKKHFSDEITSITKYVEEVFNQNKKTIDDAIKPLLENKQEEIDVRVKLTINDV